MVKFEDHEYSGNMRIDGIGEMIVRLRGTFDNEAIILNISISEHMSTLEIVFSDVSYAPPYRIENLTKSSFKVCQIGSRQTDFDIVGPYVTMSYALSYPHAERLLKLSLVSSTAVEELDDIKIDQMTKVVRYDLKGKESQFTLEIVNEGALKTIRIMYADDIKQASEEDEQKLKSQSTSRIAVNLSAFGISLITAQARELAYIYFRNLTASYEKQPIDKKISFALEDFQIDNQLSRQDDSIVMRKDHEVKTAQVAISGPEGGDMDPLRQFLAVKLQFQQNDVVQNLFLFRYFYLVMSPVSLSLDGNFVDEVFRYASDIF
jgi:hypothetical protein